MLSKRGRTYVNLGDIRVTNPVDNFLMKSLAYCFFKEDQDAHNKSTVLKEING